MIKFLINLVVTIAVSLAIISMIIGKADASETWTQSTYELHNKMQELGMDKELAEYVINSCKNTSINPRKCVKTYTSHYGNESSFGKRCINYACWGRRFVEYESPNDAFDDWLWRYNKYWYKHNGGDFFYGGYGWLGKSGFCHDEVSSGSKLGCPNGAKVFNYFYNSI